MGNDKDKDYNNDDDDDNESSSKNVKRRTHIFFFANSLVPPAKTRHYHFSHAVSLITHENDKKGLGCVKTWNNRMKKTTKKGLG